MIDIYMDFIYKIFRYNFRLVDSIVFGFIIGVTAFLFILFTQLLVKYVFSVYTTTDYILPVSILVAAIVGLVGSIIYYCGD